MRLPFNKRCELVRGPGHVDAGLRYAQCDCRYVPETAQFPGIFPLVLRDAYVTLADFRPREPTTDQLGSVVLTDYDQADRIAIPVGSFPQLLVMFVETVHWKGHPVYYRAHVCIGFTLEDAAMGLTLGSEGVPAFIGLDLGSEGEPAFAGLDLGSEGVPAFTGLDLGSEGEPAAAGLDLGSEGEPAFAGLDLGSEGDPAEGGLGFGFEV